MGWGPGTARCHVELARMGLGVGDELGNRLGRDRWIHYQDLGCADDGRDRRDVADEVEIDLVVERGVDRVVTTDKGRGEAVGGAGQAGCGADIAPAAGRVLDDE